MLKSLLNLCKMSTFPLSVNFSACSVRGVNRGMQIRGSVLFFGPIRRSDVIFVQIRIRITLKLSVECKSGMACKNYAISLHHVGQSSVACRVL